MTINEIRLGSFLLALIALWLLQQLLPRRPMIGGWQRQITNIALVIIDAIALKLVLPAAAIGAAWWASQQSLGLFKLVELPLWLSVICSVLLLDLAIYWQHRLMHTVPILWRLHRVHHSDLMVDVSTGFRFHPIEILLSMALKMGLVVLLGAPVIAVVVFELLLNLLAMFNHSNLRLPIAADRVIRKLVVTPDMHRVHHSVQRHETNSNYGFFLSCWDRCFASYIAQPEAGHGDMQIGLAEFRQADEQTLWSLLKQPFVRLER